MIVNSDALDVPCPTCGADAGAECTRQGRAYTGGKVHIDRARSWETTTTGSGGESGGTAPDETKTLIPDPDRPGAYENP